VAQAAAAAAVWMWLPQVTPAGLGRQVAGLWRSKCIAERIQVLGRRWRGRRCAHADSAARAGLGLACPMAWSGRRETDSRLLGSGRRCCEREAVALLAQPGRRVKRAEPRRGGA